MRSQRRGRGFCEVRDVNAKEVCRNKNKYSKIVVAIDIYRSIYVYGCRDGKLE